MKRVIVAIILVSFLIFVSGATGCTQKTTNDSEPQLISEKVIDAISGPQVNLSGNVVYMNKEGFFPKTLIIKPQEIVTFYNNNTSPHWPASAIHPTHLSYPKSGGCIGSTFDACKEIEPGKTFVFKFELSGDWKYHDHLSLAYGYGEIKVNN